MNDRYSNDFQMMRLSCLRGYFISSICLIVDISYLMPNFSIILSARTENVESIKIHQENIWLLKVKCSTCNNSFPKDVGVTKTEEVELEKQHGTANFSAKCKNCDRKGFITILPTSSYEAKPDEDGMVKQSLVDFECRGIEITQAIMGDYFSVHVKGSNEVFSNADFNDLWCEYDENISAVAQVEDPKLDIARLK